MFLNNFLYNDSSQKAQINLLTVKNCSTLKIKSFVIILIKKDNFLLISIQ